MNEKINLDLKSLKFIFDKNKVYIYPIVVIFISIILFFQFIIPQFRSLLAVREDALAASLKIKTLKTNLDILTNINEEVLDSQLKTLKTALPLNKDFFGILNSIYGVSQKIGANLGNFSLKIGDMSKSESGDVFSVVKLFVPVNSNTATIGSFVEEIEKALPLAEVNSIKIGQMSSTIGLSFYYKQLNSSNYNQDVPISPVSQKALILINKLSEFINPSLSISSDPSLETEVPVATSSADQ